MKVQACKSYPTDACRVQKRELDKLAVAEFLNMLFCGRWQRYALKTLVQSHCL